MNIDEILSELLYKIIIDHDLYQDCSYILKLDHLWNASVFMNRFAFLNYFNSVSTHTHMMKFADEATKYVMPITLKRVIKSSVKKYHLMHELEVQSFRPLSDEEKSLISEAISENFMIKKSITFTTNERIIYGIKIMHNMKMIDLSIC